MQPSKDITRLLEIMEALRQPETGCPWDIVQTFETIKPYTLEEAYEVADAIERADMDDLCDELGDLLRQGFFTPAWPRKPATFRSVTWSRPSPEK
jgi:ATP diphosphatase